jgi:hypothetical protein
MDTFDAADTEWMAANRDAEERAVTFIREALTKGCNTDDGRALCWLAGIEWRMVEPNPQRRAA